MLWSKEFVGLVCAQVFFGTYMATEVAYYTYIYAKVERSKYQMVTGHTRSAILCGRFLGAVFAQLFITMQWMNYRQLNYLSFGCKRTIFDIQFQFALISLLSLLQLAQCISLVWSLLLPSVGISLYFYNQANPPLEDLSDTYSNKRSSDSELSDTSTDRRNAHLESGQNAVKRKFSATTAFSLITSHVKTSYSNAVVVQWSLWWAVSMCGFLQVNIFHGFFACR